VVEADVVSLIVLTTAQVVQVVEELIIQQEAQAIHLQLVHHKVIMEKQVYLEVTTQVVVEAVP
jgi:hypothetical protein